MPYIPIPSSPFSEYLFLFRSAIFSFSWRRPKAPSSYNALINSFLTPFSNHTFAASSGLPLTTCSYTIFLKLILTSKRFHDAYSLLQKMINFGPQPDSITYSTFIAALSRDGKISEALRLFNFMIQNECCPTPQACTSIVHAYCSQGFIKEAKHFLGFIQTYGIAPDRFMYTALIDSLSRNGEFEEVEKILGESRAKGWEPDQVTYNVYMNGLCKAGKIVQSFQVLDEMRCNGLLPNLETLNILFDSLCRDCKLQEAMDLLGKSYELDWSPDVVFYNTLLSRYLDHGCSTDVLCFLSDMMKRGIEPDSCTLTLIIRSMFSVGKLQLARCMINRTWNFVPDVVAFNTLLHQFYLSGENNEVVNLFADMIQKNVIPNKFTYCIVIDSLYKEERIEEAIDLVLGTIRDDFMWDLHNRLLRWLARGHKLGAILKLFQKLGQYSIIDVACLNSLILSCCKTGICQSQDFYKLSLIIEKIFRFM